MKYIDPKTETIAIDYPNSQDVHLRLKIGVGKLKLNAGGEKLVSGTITYNVEEWVPKIYVSDGTVTLKQGESTNDHGIWKLFHHPVNDWDLWIGTARPLDLYLSTGVAPAQITTGGLPLTRLTYKAGVGNAMLNFDKVNPQRAEMIKIEGGVGNLDLKNVLDANANRLDIEAGTGQINIDFTGEKLFQTMTANITTGVGEIVLNVEEATPTRILTSQGLGKIKARGQFYSAGRHIYETKGFSSADGPKLIVSVTSGLGNITLNTLEAALNR